MNEQRENFENQAMQEQLNNDPDFLAWEKAMDEQDSESRNKLDASLDALINEVNGGFNGA